MRGKIKKCCEFHQKNDFDHFVLFYSFSQNIKVRIYYSSLYILLVFHSAVLLSLKCTRTLCRNREMEEKHESAHCMISQKVAKRRGENMIVIFKVFLVGNGTLWIFLGAAQHSVQWFFRQRGPNVKGISLPFRETCKRSAVKLHSYLFSFCMYRVH